MESTPAPAAPAAAAPSTDSPSPEPEAHAAGSGDELNFDQAERFAASYRPSWAPDHPIVPSVPAPVHSSGPARVVRVGTRSDLSAPKIRKQRGAAYAILSASLLGVAGLFYLAIASSSTKPAATDLARSTSTPKSEPVETSVQAAQQPPAAPAVTPPPAEPAAQPAAEPEQLAAAEPAPSEPAAVAEPTAEEPPAAAPKEPEVAAAEPAPAEPAPAPAPAAVAVAPAPAPPPPAAPAAPAAPVVVAAPKAPPPAAPAAAVVAAAPAAVKVAPPSAAAPQPAAQRPPERPAKVMLSLAAFPPNAQLRIDGGIVENPFRMRLARTTKHKIEARAPGFASETHVVQMDADVQLMISLKRDAIRDVKPDPYKDARHSAANGPSPARRGAGFVSENPY